MDFDDRELVFVILLRVERKSRIRYDGVTLVTPFMRLLF
jgi:hypothetical protein